MTTEERFRKKVQVWGRDHSKGCPMKKEWDLPFTHPLTIRWAQESKAIRFTVTCKCGEKVTWTMRRDNGR